MPDTRQDISRLPLSRRSLLVGGATVAAGLGACSWLPGPAAARDVILATTTSTQDSGLLDVLVPAFEKASDFKVKTIAVGTGQALTLGARGEADVLLVHAPDSEKKFIEDGHGTSRRLVMYNDFVLVGPKTDPAGIRGQSVASGLANVAQQGRLFVSRGDNSGTHQLEKKLWEVAALKPAGQAWYQESGTGMGATLGIAAEKQAYTLADRGTWLAQRARLDLAVLVEGDAILLNIYHVITVEPKKNSRINGGGGRAFADFVVSADVQHLIGSYGVEKYGQALFTPAANRRETDLGK